MSGITTTVSPEYDFIDSLPGLPQHTIDQFQSNNQTPSRKLASPRGYSNISTRPLPAVNKPSIPSQSSGPLSTQGNDTSLIGPGIGKAELSDSDKPPTHTTPSTLQTVHNHPGTSPSRPNKLMDINPSKHPIQPQANGENTNSTGQFPTKRTPGTTSQDRKQSSNHLAQQNSNSVTALSSSGSNPQQYPMSSLSSGDCSSSGGKPSDVYHPLELDHGSEDSVYEKLDKNKKTGISLSEDGQFGDCTDYQPLQKNVQHTTYEELKPSDSSA